MLLYYMALKSLITLSSVLLHTGRDHHNLDMYKLIRPLFKQIWKTHTHKADFRGHHSPSWAGNFSQTSPADYGAPFPPAQGSQALTNSPRTGCPVAGIYWRICSDF